MSLSIVLVGCGISGLPKKYEIIYYPLGLMSLAAYLREHGYSNIEIANSDFMYRKNLSGIPQFLFELIKTVALVLFYLNPIRILKVVKVFKDFNIEWRFYSRFKHILSLYFLRKRADEGKRLCNLQRFNVPSSPKKEASLVAVGVKV